MHYVLQQFLKAKLWWDNTSLQKIKRSSAQNKKTFKLMYVHVQYAYTCEWPGLRKGVVAVPSQGPAHTQQLQDWPDYLQHASLHYQLPPAACRKAQPYFHCLWLCFRVADHSWPVAMADCCICPTLGPFISNLYQSTSPSKLLQLLPWYLLRYTLLCSSYWSPQTWSRQQSVSQWSWNPKKNSVWWSDGNTL